MSLQEVRDITGTDAPAPEAVFKSVSIDTRTLQPGDLFVAISGPNFDGNDFVAEAQRKQASAALVSRVVESELPCLKVEDTRRALGQLGAFNRSLSQAPVLALTGSQGKTTVKEMLAQILANRSQVLMTRGNLNNELGVPLTLLNIEPQHEYVVVEMGANGPGEIAQLTALVQPHIAHVTNAAATHLAGFGSVDGVARAKGEIWEGIRSGGVAVINIDDPYAGQWHKRASGSRIVSISARGEASADYHVSGICIDNKNGSSFKLYSPQGSTLIQLHLLGKHNIANALAAAAMALEAGASLEDVRQGLARVQPVAGRLCLKKGRQESRVIDDSYNASPASFRAAIDVLNSFPGKKVLAMGDMGELGSGEGAAHAELGRYARLHGVDRLFATGPLSEATVGSFGAKAVHRDSLEDLAQEILPLLQPEVTVLVKGSRSARMDRLVQQLTQDEG